MNFCRSCKRDFGSLYAFDEHRIGTHQYTYHEGVQMEPMKEDGRRCLRSDEMTDWAQDGNGRWRTPSRKGFLRMEHARRALR
jgi:hypothetical protein